MNNTTASFTHGDRVRWLDDNGALFDGRVMLVADDGHVAVRSGFQWAYFGGDHDRPVTDLSAKGGQLW